MTTKMDLDEARRVLHALMIGKHVTSVTKNGRSVTFAPSDLPALKKYIAELEASLGVSVRRRGPAGVRL